MIKHFDFLGNELFDGDEVVTIEKNYRAKGGHLTRTTVSIDNKGVLSFTNRNLNLYKRGIADVCVKVKPNVSCAGCIYNKPENVNCIHCARNCVDYYDGVSYEN